MNPTDWKPLWSRYANRKSDIGTIIAIDGEVGQRNHYLKKGGLCTYPTSHSRALIMPKLNTALCRRLQKWFVGWKKSRGDNSRNAINDSQLSRSNLVQSGGINYELRYRSWPHENGILKIPRENSCRKVKRRWEGPSTALIGAQSGRAQVQDQSMGSWKSRWYASIPNLAKDRVDPRQSYAERVKVGGRGGGMSWGLYPIDDPFRLTVADATSCQKTCTHQPKIEVL